ncbi:MAG: multicopper oxidase domain-containing protein, partial [Syntrophorhabdales bacterium]
MSYIIIATILQLERTTAPRSICVLVFRSSIWGILPDGAASAFDDGKVKVMIDRRDFLRITGWTAAGLAIPLRVKPVCFLASLAYGAEKKRTFSGNKLGRDLSRFVDALPIIPAMPNTGAAYHYKVALRQFTQRVHRDLPPTPVWGFAVPGFTPSWPGPTIEAVMNMPTRVRWINDLPSTHLLASAVDHTIHGAEREFPDVRAVIHLHGGATEAESDGYPEDWYSPTGVRMNGSTGPNYVDYTYHNGQLPTALWYHDHALGITRLGIFAGLVGLYLIRDASDTGGPPTREPDRARPGENSMGLPGPAPGHGGPPYHEIPLVIQDRSFNSDGTLAHPAIGVNPKVHPQWVQDYFGDVICVNGKAWPHLEVEPRRYRFRLLNGCNSRVLDLKVDPPQALWQIGSDGGFLPHVVSRPTLLLAPAERADVVLDFTGMSGATLTLLNLAPSPFVDGEPPDPQTTGQVMQFRVLPNCRDVDRSMPPESIALPACADLRSLVTPEMLSNPRRAYLNVIQGKAGPRVLTLSDTGWMDPVTEKPRIGSIEVWEIMNLANDLHPIHLHLTQFQLLNRQLFDVSAYKKGVAHSSARSAIPDPAPYLKGKPTMQPPEEAGWKDTIVHPAGAVTRFVTRWAPQAAPLRGPGSPTPGANLYPFDPTRGKYVWHCHNL